MFKNIFKILLALTFIFSSANALQKDEIQSQMNTKIDNILVILKNKELTNGKKGEQIIKIIDEVFDYEVMAKIALGKEAWLSVDNQKQEEFVKAFENRLKNSYIEKLELYTDQKVNIVSLEPYKKTRLQLNTEVVGSDETYKINYKFYNNKKVKEWLIYDVDLLGVSIVQTYKQQFAGELKQKSFDELLAALKKTDTKK